MQIVLGPWPLFPGFAFAFLMLLYFIQNFQLALVAPEPLCRVVCITMPDAFAPAIIETFGASLQSEIDPVLVFANALLAAAAGALVLWGWKSAWRGSGEFASSRTRFLLALATAALISGIVRVYLVNPLLGDVPGLEAVIPQAIRSLAALIVVHSLAGVLTRRYTAIAQMAQESLAEVERQQRLIVEADERARREVADFLHDRVQADLLVLALEVRRAAESLGPEDAARLAPTIAALERLRSEDVRGAGRRLSPDLDAIGLDTALAELAASWRGALAVTVNWGPGTQASLVGPEVPPELPRAAYRIVEQALLNAVAHGRAGSCRVDIRRVGNPPGGAVEIDVVDDGSGLPTPIPRPGSGWAVIEAWTSITGGSWSVASAPDGGVVVGVRIPTIAADRTEEVGRIP